MQCSYRHRLRRLVLLAVVPRDLVWIITILWYPAYCSIMVKLEMVLEQVGVGMGLHGLRRHFTSIAGYLGTRAMQVINHISRVVMVLAAELPSRGHLRGRHPLLKYHTILVREFPSLYSAMAYEFSHTAS